MDLQRIKAWIEQKPMVAYPVIGVSTLIVVSAISMFSSPSRSSVNSAPSNKEIGISVGGIDQQAYVTRLEKNYYDFEARVKNMEEQVKGIKSLAQELKKTQKDMAKTVLKLNEEWTARLDEKLNTLPAVGLPGADTAMELSVADIKPVEGNGQDVHLPIGSFCKGTLLTGVYAAADANNPLPVLIALDEAFYGPNQTRIPLKGSFMLGKAYGDLVSQRALIQIVAVSSVLPNGQAFEHESDLGYVTDAYGEMGIHGQVIRNTGKELAVSFMGGFMSGGSQALADQEVSSTGGYGVQTREVTGNPAKNAVFSGLAKSAGQMSEYYQKQTENLVPAVHVHNGITVYVVIQKGVRIDGLPRAEFVGLR